MSASQRRVPCLSGSLRRVCSNTVAPEALAEILYIMSAQLLVTQSMPVGLPGAGCTVTQVLASAERCAELHAALTVLAEGL